MSFKAFVWAWEQDVPNADYQHVLLALADIAPVREVKASVLYVAAKVRRSPRKVRAAILWLSEVELIAITPRPGRADIIRLNIPANFMVSMEDDGDLENGVRGRPKKTPVRLENPCTETAKPLANPCPPCADEPREPEEEPRLEADASLPIASAPLPPGRVFFNAWNTFAVEHDKPTATKFTSDRAAAFRGRLKDWTLEEMLEAISKISSSEFLMGRTPERFTISLDFVLQASSLRKLIEGFYHGRRTTHAPGDRRAADHASRNAAMFAGAEIALSRPRQQ